MHRRWWQFWNRSAWREWSAEHKAWLSYKAAHNDLSSRIAGTNSRLGSAHQSLKDTRQALAWVEPLGTGSVPIDLRKMELGLAVVPQVTLLELRKREGTTVWVPVATGSVSFTDRRAVFTGDKDVTFDYKDLTDASLQASGLHLSVSQRKTGHVLAGPAQQLHVTLEACRSVGVDVDPMIPLREAEREGVSAVTVLQAELADLNQARRSLERPLRPFSPGWAAGALFAVVLFGASSGLADQFSVISQQAPTTLVTSESETSSPLAVLTTTTLTSELLVTVASITDGDTFRAILPDGTNEPVRLIGIDSPESGQYLFAEAKAHLASLIEGNEILLVADVSERDRFDRLLRYVYVDELFVNLAMVESGYAIAVDYPPDTAKSNTLATGAEKAEAAALGLWATNTTVATTTTTTLAPTTTVTTSAPPTTAAPAPPSCHPSYEGVCLQMGIGDYDCAGGSGNGPNYVRGPVNVVGYDEFDLDRDGNGVGCEP